MFLASFFLYHFLYGNLEIDFLTLQMTLNYQNNTINGFYGKNPIKMRYYTCFRLNFSKIIFLHC